MPKGKAEAGTGKIGKDHVTNSDGAGAAGLSFAYNVVPMRASAATGLVACALVITACGAHTAEPLSDEQLQTLVLQSADLPRTLERFSSDHELRSEQSPILEGDSGRFGRQNGWVARYRRSGNPRLRGPLTVASTIEMFGRSAGASKYLHAVEKRDREVASLTGLKELRVSAIGATSHGLESAHAPRGSIRYVIVTWREGRFVGIVSASGYAELMSARDVVALARSQEKRVKRVS